MTVTCATGKRLLGGGAAACRRFAERASEGIALTESLPIGDSWIASAREVTPTDQDWVLQVTAICANVQ